ncbi:MAG: FadR family transcriptional regulator [Oscillospiraceae bacterium]|nr:FadR family transcriptional regulator [Oscillospiraceae bacterium]
MRGQKSNVAANLLTLRRWLKLTQREFIHAYLVDEAGTPLISVATLSGVENGIQSNVLPLTASIATKLAVDAGVFEIDPDSFAKNIELFFGALVSRHGDPAYAARGGNTVESLVQTLSDYLMSAMISGELQPGDKLPSDRSLSTTYGVGRSSIREALKVLSALGLIHISPGQGTFVASQHTDFFQAPLAWTLFIGQKDTIHLLELRGILEAETACLAAANADESALAELASNYEQMQAAYKSSNFQAFLDSDLGFHLAVARCSGNPIYHRLLHTARKMLSYISRSGMVTIEQLHEIDAEHRAIYTAIVEGDRENARRQMQIHLERARNRYRL